MLGRSALAFVDVETTGMSPSRDRIIEIAVVRVQWPADDHGPPEVREFVTLVRPGVAVSPEIRFLTGIDDARLADAPTFGQVADTVTAWLDGALFIAHQARFDHGFLKAEFARCGRAFSAEPLCTVRLSRALTPERPGHGLDALIARYRLGSVERHTALGDARVLWRLLRRWTAEFGHDTVLAAARRLLARPSLPAHLGLDSVSRLPARPGVYAFLGAHGQPLYIGKSLNLRERVPAHFSADHRSERGLRLASEIRALRWQVCAGEFGALLAEANAIGTLMPAHNRALRRAARPVILVMDEDGLAARPRPWSDGPPPDTVWAGPFTSRAQARAWLTGRAREAGLCMATLGLERVFPGRACFAHQLDRCAGTCIDPTLHDAHSRALAALLHPERAPDWPAGRALLLREHDPDDDRRAWHLLEDWRWLGSATTQTELRRLLADPPPGPGAADETAPPEATRQARDQTGTGQDALTTPPTVWTDDRMPSGPVGTLAGHRPPPGPHSVRLHRLLRGWFTPAVMALSQPTPSEPADLPLPAQRRRDRCRYRLRMIDRRADAAGFLGDD